MPRSDAVCLAGPGLVVRGGPECGSFGLWRGTHVVWALTAPEHGTSDMNNRSVKPIHSERAVCFSIKKQLKIINHKVNKTMHSPALSQSTSLPHSRAIRNVRFPTYEVVTSSLHSVFLLNNVIFHWLITMNIYVKKICAVFCVKCKEWQVGCHRLFFLLAEYSGVIFTLTSRNITWFYYCNFDFILKIRH